MKKRINNILATILIFILSLSIIYLIDFYLYSTAERKSKENHTKLTPIDKKIERKEYKEAQLAIDNFLNNEESIFFLINLKTRKAICYIHQGEIEKGKAIMNELIITYPFIQWSEGIYKNCTTQKDYLEYANLVIKTSNEIESTKYSPMNISNIIKNMGIFHYLSLISIIAGISVLLDQINKIKISKNRSSQ